jgi:hypothetical protein
MKRAVQRYPKLFRSNVVLGRRLWGEMSRDTLRQLRRLTEDFRFSVAAGDVLFLDGRWYVTHAGLLRTARRRRCAAIETSLEADLSSPTANRWIFKAIVHTRRYQQRFSGYGDADPSNVSPLVRGAEMRVAETRAVNRALRKAYGIGLCSVEELGWLSGSPKPSFPSSQPNGSHSSNGSNNGHPRLRDQLCLLIRQYNLDPNLVKAYAADFCGTATIKDASRDLVESFISHVSSSAKEDLDGLICKLNSYSQPVEVKQ